MVAWALWDCGSTGVSAIVVTFVFSVYLTRSVGDDPSGDTSPASGLGWALFFSGVTVALLAPVTGVLAAEVIAGDEPSHDLAPLSPDRF